MSGTNGVDTLAPDLKKTGYLSLDISSPRARPSIGSPLKEPTSPLSPRAQVCTIALCNLAGVAIARCVLRSGCDLWP
eukprot:2199116-Rhodomonas_salina.2